jgi:putative tricarboxylic transport membrane protein
VRQRDLVLGGVLAAVAIGYLVAAARLPSNIATRTDLGPNVYPLALGGALLIAVVVLVVGAVVRDPTSAHKPTSTLEPTATRTAWGPLLVALTAIGLYVWLLGLVGFILASTIYLAASTRLLDTHSRYRGTRGAVIPAVYGLVTSTTIYVLFDQLLGVLLPPGLLLPAVTG